MSVKYKNITNVTQILAVVSEDKTSVSHVPLDPGAVLEVNANLDIYVPHILAKLDASDVNISHLVVKARQEIKEVVEKIKEEVKEEVKESVEKVETQITETAEKTEEVVGDIIDTAIAVVKNRKTKKN